jgi:C4-dicarboxylate-specific signal transduction histidine kinase
LLAHELNQPLASIAMYAETGAQALAQKTPDPARLSRLLTQIGEQSLHAGEIIRGLRKFVSRGRIETVPMDLNAAIRDACSLMEKKATSLGIRLDLELDETLPAVMGDELHTGQVLLNLLQNAIEAIHSADVSDGNIRVHSGCVEGEARVSVFDDGPGVDATAVDSMCMQLASDKPHGLGVGLRIARSLVEAQGGRLWPEPHRPGGIFHFTLPLAP